MKNNSAPVDHFDGLSPVQMHRFLSFPFDSPNLASLPLRLDCNPQAPVLKLFTLLVDGLGEKGLTATATGNLPRNFCRQLSQAYLGEEEYQRWWRHTAFYEDMFLRAFPALIDQVQPIGDYFPAEKVVRFAYRSLSDMTLILKVQG
jgi:hypothetical protein